MTGIDDEKEMVVLRKGIRSRDLFTHLFGHGAPAMSATHCPLCYEPLEVRDVGPCMECGSDPREIDEARAGDHTYAEYRIFDDLSLVLCDFCQSDFSSYDPTFFGLPQGTRVGLESGWRFLRDVEPVITKDKCCPKCGYRLPFLEFVARARELHSEAH